jgi:predicted DNA-binding transcriptional regulator
MSKDEEKTEEKEIVVYVEGKLVPLKQLQKRYEDISLAGTPGNVKVMDVLVKAEKPLNKAEIAKRAGLSEAYVRDKLKVFLKGKYVLEFRMGKPRTFYYLLTEGGLKLSKEITKQ